MKIAIVRDSDFGIVIKLQHHLAARVRKESPVCRRTKLPRDGHAEVFAIPLCRSHRVSDVESDVFNIHADIVVEKFNNDKQRVTPP